MAIDESLSWTLERGQSLRREARQLFRQGVLLKGVDEVEAELCLRRALSVAASAFNWLEDTEYEDQAHADLHCYGTYTREHFKGNCELGWTGQSYEERCPVSVAHKRIGFSIGFTAQRFCSVCGEDLSTCEHVPGRFYDVPGGFGETGVCRVCLRPDCVDHVAEKLYRARAASKIRNMSMVEVSLVAKPKHPDARLLAVPVDSERLQEFLGPDFKMGMRVSCDQCLGSCAGLDRPFRDGVGGHG